MWRHGRSLGKDLGMFAVMDDGAQHDYTSLLQRGFLYDIVRRITGHMIEGNS